MGNAPGKQRAGGRYVHWDTAVTPAPPGKPHLVPGTPHTQPDLVTIRWEPPVNDGGSPVTGYLVEHRRTGSPHWVRATPGPVPVPEVTLSGLEPGWRYQFRVSAMNDVGLSEPGDVSEPLTVALHRSETHAPLFLTELRDVVTLENDTAEFHVVFRGTPAPKIAWYKDGFEIFSSRRMRVVTEGGKSSLVIFQSAFADEGDFKCTATNRAGHVVSKAKLRLEAPPRVRLPRKYEDGLLFEKGEVIRLKVSVAGRPLPRVTWLHNGEPVPFGGRYDVTHTERASALRVTDARRADRGEYQVRASSRLGEDVASFLVTVTDRPTPPGRALLKGAQERWVDLEWTEPSDDGGCKIGNYIVEYYRIGWNVWLKAATCRQLSTRLEELIEGSEYKFRVKAENPYGVSDPGDESDTVFIPDPRRGLTKPPAQKVGVKPTNGMLNQRAEDLPQVVVEINEKRQIDRKPLIQIGNKTNREIKDVFDAKKRKELADDVPPPVPPKTLKKTKGPQAPQRHQREQKASSLPPEKPADIAVQPTQKRKSEEQRASDKKLLNPLTPREEDDSILHGSSELMLVLLPESSEADGGQSNKGAPRPSTDFGQGGLQESVAPPMSLSAPELGSGEAPMGAPLRNAVSSSELLHERAMARFYQSVAAEEAERALERRRSLESASAGAGGHGRARSAPAPAFPAPAPPPAPEEDLRSVGREREQRLSKDRERAPTPEIVFSPERAPSPEPPASPELALSPEPAYEDEEVDMDEPYDESMDEDEMFEMGAPEPPPFRARFSGDEEEEETYHPRCMLPRTSREPSPPPPVPPHARSPPPLAFKPKPILKKPKSPSPPPPILKKRRSPSPPPPVLRKYRSPSPSPSPPPLALPERVSPSPPPRFFSPPRSPTPPRSPSPLPVPLPVPSVLKKSPSPVPIPIPIPVLAPPVLKKSPSPTPLSVPPAVKKSPSPTPLLAPPAARTSRSPSPLPPPPPPEPVVRRRPSRQQSAEEEEALAHAINEHYGHIISEYGRSHRPQKRLFTNTAELKAAVEHQPRPLFDPKARPAQPPPRPKTTEEEAPPPPEEEPPKKTRRWWSWIYRFGFGGGGGGEDAKEESEATEKPSEGAPPTAKLSRRESLKAEEEPPSKVAERKARSALEYVTDLAMFTVACWLYVFGDELLAVPILLLMVYRQLRDALSSWMPDFMRSR